MVRRPRGHRRGCAAHASRRRLARRRAAAGRPLIQFDARRERGSDRRAVAVISGRASADHPDLALAHAAAQLAHGRLEEAAAQLALAESHVESAAPARRRRLTVAIASLRLALARRSGQFKEVIEQVNLLDSSIADESSGLIAMSSELRGVALMNLGIVETVVRATRWTPTGTSPRERSSPGRSAAPTSRSRASRIEVSRQGWSRS